MKTEQKLNRYYKLLKNVLRKFLKYKRNQNEISRNREKTSWG